MTPSRLSSHLQHPPDGIEEPTMRIDLLLILGFDHENNLDGNQITGISARLRKYELRIGID